MEEIKSIIENIQLLRDSAYNQFLVLTEDIVSDRITDIQKIEWIMDRVGDFLDEDRFIDLYRKICKHIYFNYPEIVGEHVTLYKALWMTKDDVDTALPDERKETK